MFFVKFLINPFIYKMVLKFQGICTAKGILVLEESQMNSKTRKPAVHNLSELKIPQVGLLQS